MRQVDVQQFGFIIALCIIASATALFVDEAAFNLGGLKMKYRDVYWVWMLSSLFFVALAVACIQFISPLA